MKVESSQPKLNKDDEMAMRVLSLLLWLLDNRYTSKEKLLDVFYPEANEESQQKQFDRDRDRLEELGFIIDRNEKGYYLSENQKRPAGSDSNDLDQKDFITILQLLFSMALRNDTSVFSFDLHIALMKLGIIDQRFMDSLLPACTKGPDFDKAFSDVSKAINASKSLAITYTSFQGKTHAWNIQPYGTYKLFEQDYVICNVFEGKKNLGIRTLNFRRIGKTDLKKSASFTVPRDFNKNDYIRLPFQLGETKGQAKLFIPEAELPTFLSETLSVGTLGDEDARFGSLTGKIWTISFSDLDACASWATRKGFYCLEPADLRQQQVNSLREVLS